MTRTTKKQVESVFAMFVRAIGGNLATSYNDVGGYALDYNGVYGGYQVIQILSEGGAQTCPFGYERRPAAEMWSVLRFAIDAVELVKRQGGQS